MRKLWIIFSVTMLFYGIVIADNIPGESGSKRITLSFDNIALSVVLDKIIEISGIPLVYSNDIVKSITLSYECMDKPVTEALGEILEGKGLGFRVLENQQIIIVRRGEEIERRKIKISGAVSDIESGGRLPGANIIIKSTLKGTVSDAFGNFQLDAITGDTLIFQYIGYKTTHRKVGENGDSEKLAIEMVPTSFIMNEITVFDYVTYQYIEEKSNLNVRNRAIRKLSGSLRDAMLAMKSLPGVNSRSGFESRFNVRGGDYDENLVLIDNVEVYMPYHLKWAEIVSIGIFNLDLTGKVTLNSGGFSAKYGDKLSSLLRIKYREGNPDRIMGKMMYSVSDLNFYLEGPLRKDLTFVLGCRKSFLDYLMRFSDSDDGLRLDFWDVHVHLTYAPDPDDKFSFLFIRSGDNLKLPAEHEEHSARGNGTITVRNETLNIFRRDSSYVKTDAVYTTGLFDFQWNRTLNSNMSFNYKLSYYDEFEDTKGDDDFYINYEIDDSLFYRWQRIGIMSYYTKREVIENQLEFAFRPYSRLEFEAGIKHKNIDFDLDILDDNSYQEITNYWTYPEITLEHKWYSESDVYRNEEGSFNSYKTSGYLQGIWHAGKKLTLGIGGRADYYDLNRDLNLSPRINIYYKQSKKNLFRIAWGQFYQSPQFYELKYYHETGRNPRAQKSTHYIAGFESEVSSFFSVKTEVYYKKLSNLIPETFLWNYIPLSGKGNTAEGFCKGFDFRFLFKHDVFSGWVSYGYLIAKEDDHADSLGYYYRSTDQRHSLSLSLDMDLPDNWELNYRLSYGSGFAYTPYFISYESGYPRWEKGRINSKHLPSYQRFDIRIDKKFVYSNFTVSAFVDFYNVLGVRNIWNYSYNYKKNNKPKRNENTLVPLIPFVGLSIAF